MGLFRKKQKDSISSFIQENFGIYPKKIALYHVALTHKSFDQNLPNNERLEFLGDSVINTIVAQYLFEKFPNEDEGFLTKLRSRIVSRENLNEIGLKIKLLELVRYFKGKNEYKSLVGNVFEALVGAIYLDIGFEKTKDMFFKQVLENLIDIEKIRKTDTDYKSQLLVWSQKNNRKLDYVISETKGENAKYLAKIYISGRLIAESTGTSKKEAEKRAAKSACHSTVGKNR